MSRFLAFVALFVALCVEARPAEACLPPNVVVPAPDTANVPINLVEVVTGNPFVQPGPYVRKAGTELPVAARTVEEWGLRRIQFAALLEPNTIYEVMWGGSVYSTFVTGDATDVGAPGAITVDDVAISYAMLEPPSSCGPEDVEVIGPTIDVEPLLRVRVTGAGLVQERMVPGDGFHLLGWETARLALDVVPNEIYDVEVWARDYAGNEGPVTRIEGVRARDCGTLDYSYSGLLRDCPLDVIELPDTRGDTGCAASHGSSSGAVAIAAMLIVAKRRRRRAR